MKRKIRIAKTNPNFSLTDDSRPLFYNTKYATKNNKDVAETTKYIKDKWVEETFDVENDIKSFNQPTRLTGSVRLAVDDNTINKFMNVRYIMLNNYKDDDTLMNTEFYFVEGNVMSNSKTVTLTLRLDTVTTYFDKLTFGKSAKIERRHFDRWKVDGDKLIANNDENSGLWNDENDINNNTFVNVKNEPINVLDSKNYDQYVNRTKFYSVALMRTRVYGGIDYESYSYLGSNDNVPFNVGIWLLNMKTKVYDADGQTVDINGSFPIEYQLNKHYSSYIERIFASPLPFIPPEYLTVQSGGYEVNAMNADSSTHGQAGRDKVRVYKLTETDTKTEWVIRPNDISSNSMKHLDSYIDEVSRGFKPIRYEKSIETKSLLKNEIDISTLTDVYDYQREIKLQSTKHKRLKIKSVNGQYTYLINEFLLGDSNIKITIELSVSMEGIFQFVKITENDYYDKANKNNEKTLVISYKDQVPNASTPYNDFMSTQGNQYKTAISNNRIKGAVGGVGGILGGMLGFATGNIGAGLGSALAGGNAVMNGALKERQFNAQVKDLQNMGSTTEVTDTSLIKDLALVGNSDYGDSKLGIVVEEHPVIQQKEISNLYNKLGYSANLTEKVSGYDWFDKRSRFTFIQAPLISDAVDKVDIGEEIINDINDVFARGVRLWSVDELGKVEINNYEKENWEHAIRTKIDEVKVPRK